MTLRVACFVVLALGLAACSSTKSMVEAKPYKQSLDLAVPAAKVFDALVAVINGNNMRMATVSKDAGVLQVAPSPVSAEDMDRYCNFPAHDSAGKPVSTFALTTNCGSTRPTVTAPAGYSRQPSAQA